MPPSHHSHFWRARARLPRAPVWGLLLAASPIVSFAQVRGAPPVSDRLIYTRAVDPADYAGNDYVLLLDESRARFEPDGRRQQTVRRVVQILTQDGAEAWGQREYLYDSTATVFQLNWLRVVAPSGDVVSHGPAHQQHATPDVPTDLPVYTDERIVRFTVGGLAPGLILDVSYTYDTFRPAYAPDFRFSWVFNAAVPVLESRFVVDLPESVRPRVTGRNLHAPARELLAEGRRILEWRADSLPAVEWEPLAGVPNEVVQAVSVTAPLTWDSIAGWYGAVTEGRREVTAAIRSTLPDILSGALTQRDTIAMIHRWIAQDFRYVSLALGDGGYRPRLPGAVFETKFGDCKDKTTLFVAILGTLGVDAYPVLLNTETSIDSLSPTMTRFTHMVAAVETARGLEFTDLTSAVTPLGRLPYSVQGKVALLVRPDRSGDIVVLPADDPDASVRSVAIGGRLSADGALQGTLTIRATGVEEPGLRQLTAGATDMSETELRALGERVAERYFGRAVVDSAAAVDGLDLWSQPGLVVWFRVPALVTSSGNRRVLPLPLPDYSMAALRRELEQDSARLFPVDAEEFNGPSTHRTEFFVDLPPGWQAGLPRSLEVNGTFGRYRAVYTQQGTTVRAMRELAGRRGIEPPDSVVALVDWLAAVGEDGAQYLVIEDRSSTRVRDSLSRVTSFTLTFGWPVGMEARVRQRASLRRTTADTADSTASEVSYRLRVADHERGRLITFNDFSVLRESGTYRPGLERMADQAARWLPGLVVDETGSFLGLDRLEALREQMVRAFQPMMDSVGADLPGLRAFVERTLTEDFYLANALEWWGPLVSSWSDVEMEVGVPYEAEADEPSPLFPERLIKFIYSHQLDSRVPCEEGRTDSACVRLVMRSHADSLSVKNLLTAFFTEILRDARANVPVVEQMDVRAASTLITEPEAMIPHHLLVTQDLVLRMRDSTGESATLRQVRERELWFEYGAFRADAADSTALLRAAAVGDIGAAMAALKVGDDVEQRDPLGRTPLIVAASSGREQVVRLLLFRGASVDATDRTGATALLWAAAGGHDGIVQRLLEAGASLDRAWEVARALGVAAAVPALQRAGLPAPPSPAAQLIDSARSVYNTNDLERALPLFVDAFAGDTASADALAWIAEVQRRLGSRPEALSVARLALTRDPCHGHAVGVIATALDPQYGNWSAANADSAWHYANRAVACSPGDGNGWLALVFKAAERGDETLEREALRRLLDTGFLTSSARAVARWLLETLPDSAVLVTNGDLDTYPLLALQVVEGVRPDVAVVNRNMLNLGWYREQMIRRHGLPRPIGDPDSAVAIKERLPGAVLVTASDSTLVWWRAASVSGRMTRPLAISITVGTTVGPEDGPGELELHGAYQLVVDTARALDAGAIGAFYADVDPRDFKEPPVASEDRSAVRQSSVGDGSDLRAIIPISAMIAVAGVVDGERGSVDTTVLRDIVPVLEFVERFSGEAGFPHAELVSNAYVKLGWAFALHGSRSLALRFSRRAVALDAENSVALNNTGYYSLLVGNLDTAIVYLERAYAARPSLPTLLNLVDANRLSGDLEAATRWSGEAETVAVGAKLEDEAFMWNTWTCDYLEIEGDSEPTPAALSIETSEEKLALLHYWIALTDAAAGRWDGAVSHVAMALDLSPRVDIHCLVHNRVDATVRRLAGQREVVARLHALADRLVARETACRSGG